MNSSEYINIYPSKHQEFFDRLSDRQRERMKPILGVLKPSCQCQLLDMLTQYMECGELPFHPNVVIHSLAMHCTGVGLPENEDPIIVTEGDVCDPECRKGMEPNVDFE